MLCDSEYQKWEGDFLGEAKASDSSTCVLNSISGREEVRKSRFHMMGSLIN